jgi:hypothetical protein
MTNTASRISLSDRISNRYAAAAYVALLGLFLALAWALLIASSGCATESEAEPDAGEAMKIRFFCPGPLCVDECDGPSPNPCICDIVPKPAGCPQGPVSDLP